MSVHTYSREFYQGRGYFQLQHFLTQIFELRISLRILKSFMTVGPDLSPQYFFLSKFQQGSRFLKLSSDVRPFLERSFDVYRNELVTVLNKRLLLWLLPFT
jgi:hypothetical protein